MKTRLEWAQEIGAEVIDFVKQHEDEEHDGEPCMAERVNLVAFLAHKVGLRSPEDWPVNEAVLAFVERMRDYEAVHQEHGHS